LCQICRSNEVTSESCKRPQLPATIITQALEVFGHQIKEIVMPSCKKKGKKRAK
jgi:hypothetical protein